MQEARFAQILTSLNSQTKLFVSDFDLTDNYISKDVLLITCSFCEMKSDLKSCITQQEEDRLYYKAQWLISVHLWQLNIDHSRVLWTIENNFSEIYINFSIWYSMSLFCYNDSMY